MSTPRGQLIAELTERVRARRTDHPTRVGIDGHSAAGKSTFADELAAALGTKTVRVGLDHFKRPLGLRTGYPAGSPESYYHEMFDQQAIANELLIPLGPGGNRHYRSQITDISGRTPVDSGVLTCPDDAILVADGAFLQKPFLAPHWDLVIYLHIEIEDVLARGTARDQAWMDSPQAAAERYRTYYIPGEQLYLTEIDPARRADIVVDNRDFDSPYFRE